MKKTRKQTILENDLSMPAIVAEFHTYKTGAQKAKYLREMEQLNLPYDVNWERLAQGYEGTNPFPVYDKKQKDIGSQSGRSLPPSYYGSNNNSNNKNQMPGLLDVILFNIGIASTSENKIVFIIVFLLIILTISVIIAKA